GEGMTEERYFPLGLSVAPRAASGRRFDYNQARHARRHFQEQSALRRHPANHGQAPKTEAQKANSQKAAGSGTAVGTVMTLSSRVTAAFNAKALPDMLAPAFRVMLWSARILP